MQARTLSGTALEAAERDVAKAQSLLILARACHSAGLKEARRYYSQACSFTYSVLHGKMNGIICFNFLEVLCGERRVLMHVKQAKLITCIPKYLLQDFPTGYGKSMATAVEDLNLMFLPSLRWQLCQSSHSKSHALFRPPS